MDGYDRRLRPCLNIVYDKVIFKRQQFGGISEYWRRLTASVQAQEGVECKWEMELPFPLLIPNFSTNAIFHSSYYRYSAGHRTRTVTTVHDFMHERGLVAHLSKQRVQLFSLLKQRAMANSSAIVCVSRATESDLQHFYPEVASRVPIYVVHHGPTLDGEFLENQRDTYSAAEISNGPFFLFVGRREAYKNFALALRALASATFQKAGFKLLVVGSRFTPEEHQLLDNLGLAHVVQNVGPIGNRHLRDLYRNSLALIYPSAHEGFGLPVLDAMFLGCPVIAASTPASLEVAGEAAEFFDVSDPETLRAAITRVLSPARRVALREQGIQRSSKFSWQKAAEQYMHVYRSAANA